MYKNSIILIEINNLVSLTENLAQSFKDTVDQLTPRAKKAAAGVGKILGDALETGAQGMANMGKATDNAGKAAAQDIKNSAEKLSHAAAEDMVKVANSQRDIARAEAHTAKNQANELAKESEKLKDKLSSSERSKKLLLAGGLAGGGLLGYGVGSSSADKKAHLRTGQAIAAIKNKPELIGLKKND